MEPSQSRYPTGGSWIDKGIYCWAKWNLISLSRKTGALWKQIHCYLTKYLKTQLYHSLLFVEMRTTLVFTQKSYTNSCMGPREQKLTGKQQILQISVVHPYNQILFTNEKEWSVNIKLWKHMKETCIKTVLLSERSQSEKARNSMILSIWSPSSTSPPHGLSWALSLKTTNPGSAPHDRCSTPPLKC